MMTDHSKLARDLVAVVLDEIRSRKGLREVFDEIDPAIKREIRAELKERVLGVILQHEH